MSLCLPSSLLETPAAAPSGTPHPARPTLQIPGVVAELLGASIYDAGLVATGGNLMTDGLGQAAATQIAYTENVACGTSDETSVPLAPCSFVDGAMRDFYGVTAYHVRAPPSSPPAPAPPPPQPPPAAPPF